jgi:hypothetical protein
MKEKSRKQKAGISSKEKKLIELIRAKEQGEIRILIRESEPIIAVDRISNIKL